MEIDKRRVPLWLVRAAERTALALRLPTTTRPLAGPPRSPEPFFIVGSGRAGTTLLRVMLSATDQVVIPPESYVIPRTIRRFVTYSFLPWEVLVHLIVSEFEAYPEFAEWDLRLGPVYGEGARLPAERRTLADIIELIFRAFGEAQGRPEARWGDKTPINTQFLDKIVRVFPRAQFVHIVRDPRATVASYMQAGLKSLDESIDTWRNAVANVDAVARGLGPRGLLEIRYEDLVTKPEATVREVCGFLGLEYSDRCLRHWEAAPRLVDVERSPHLANTHRPLSSGSLDKWRSRLDPAAVEKVETALRAQMSDRGYR